MRRAWLLCVIGLWAGLSLLAPAAQACPGCKEALLEPQETQRRVSAARAFNLSVGILLLVPVGLVGGIGAMVVTSARRKSAREAASIDTPELSR